MKILGVYAILLAAGCSSGPSIANADYSTDDASYTEEIVEQEYEESTPSAKKSNAPESDEKNMVEKKIIKTGNIQYQVDDLDKEYESLKQITQKFGAQIFSENQSSSSDRKSYRITLKIPPQNFDKLIEELIKNKKIDFKNINLSDVTDQFYDLKTRIENKQKLEERYNSLLSKAKNIKEILEIENKLNNVRGEIERMQGKLKRLSHQINFSVLNLDFYEILPYKVVDNQRPGFFARLANAFTSGGEIFTEFILIVLRLWPFALLAGLIIFLVRKFRKK